MTIPTKVTLDNVYPIPHIEEEFIVELWSDLAGGCDGSFIFNTLKEAIECVVRLSVRCQHHHSMDHINREVRIIIGGHVEYDDNDE